MRARLPHQAEHDQARQKNHAENPGEPQGLHPLGLTVEVTGVRCLLAGA